MNSLVKAIVLSISTALVAVPVMAAPQEHAPNKSHQQSHKVSAPQKHQQQNKHPAQPQQHQSTMKKSVNPSRDWRAGQKVPSQYHGQAYKVDHSKYVKLSKPAKNQQWIKVNGDYILTNVTNHNIIKIIHG